MKYMVKVLLIIPFLLIMSSCNTTETFSPDYSVDNYVELVNEAEFANVLNDNVNMKKNIEICYPMYVFDLNIDTLTVNQRCFYPDDTVIFPVLVDKVPVGFIVYLVNMKNVGEPRFFKISSLAAEKLSDEHSIRFAHAKWSTYDEYSESAMGYIFISDDNTTSELFEADFQVLCPPTVKYKEVSDLSEMGNNFKIIKHFNPKRNGFE